MKRLELSQLADADLDEILRYGTDRFGEAVADENRILIVRILHHSVDISRRLSR